MLARNRLRRLHARSLARIILLTDLLILRSCWVHLPVFENCLATRHPWLGPGQIAFGPGDSASNHLQLTTEHPGSYSVVSTQKLQSSSSINIGFGFILCFNFHSVLQFISENPTLYGLVIEQRPIFGPQGASWNIFRLFPHYSLKIWQEKRWR